MKKPRETLAREREAVYKLVIKGISTADISDITGVSESHIRKMRMVITRCTNKDLEGLRAMRDNGASGIVTWGCEKFGLVLDKPAEEKKADTKPPATPTDIDDAIHVATRLLTAEVTKAMQEQTELVVKKLEQIATIIQSCAKSIEDKTNANADIALQELQKQTEAISCVKANTKNLRIVR